MQIIYAGRVLKTGAALLSSYLPSTEEGNESKNTHVLHIVIKGPAANKNTEKTIKSESSSSIAKGPVVKEPPAPASYNVSSVQSALYSSPAFAAAYLAALQAITTADQSNGQSVVYMPTFIPVPQPTIPSQWNQSWQRRGPADVMTNEELLEVLREIQERFRERLPRNPVNGRQPRRRIQLHIQVNMRSLLQMLVLLVVVYQHCPLHRFIMLVVLGSALYLTGTERVRRILHLVTGVQRRVVRPMQHTPREQEQPLVPNRVPDQAVQAPDDHVEQQVAPAGLPVGIAFLREMQALVVGFITSLLPGWNVDPDDAVALAAAQEFVAEDDAQRVM